MKYDKYPVKNVNRIITTDYVGRKRTKENIQIKFEENATIPKIIYIGRMPFTVHPYINEPTQCWNSQKYGHVSKYCKSHCTCVFCGEKGHRERENAVEQHQDVPYAEMIIQHGAKTAHTTKGKEWHSLLKLKKKIPSTQRGIWFNTNATA